MKRYGIIMCLSVMSIRLQANVGVPLFGNATNINSPSTSLSLQQQFQLNHLLEQLALYGKQAQTYWTKDEHVAILIETTELNIQQSSATTQHAMKARVIEIFKNFGIDIYFTPDNLIKQVLEQPLKNTIKISHHIKSAKTESTENKPKQNSQPELHPIHGGRRTLNMLKEQARQRQEAWAKALELAIDAEKESLEEQAKKDVEEEVGVGL